MKKLLSIICCVLYMRSVAHSSTDIRISSPKSSGEKVLVKAISAIINREGRKKGPVKKVNLPSSGYPWV
ncbi:MAG: hypothetical protein JNK14_14965 [Chitinophagaceae bacterium]|nr:hypothetical protein [Chitinophagaceae bacterium]